MKREDLMSTPEHAAKQRYAEPYIWGCIVLFLLWVATVAAFGYAINTGGAACA